MAMDTRAAIVITDTGNNRVGMHDREDDLVAGYTAQMQDLTATADS